MLNHFENVIKCVVCTAKSTYFREHLEHENPYNNTLDCMCISDFFY